MESASVVKNAIDIIQPDCIAVELAETFQETLQHGASRLPDISVAVAKNKNTDPIYYLIEPCDPAFEALRSALEANLPSFCIDLDVDHYPDLFDPLPDTYAIQRIGLKAYYEAISPIKPNALDEKRELYMAKRLKELSFSYDRILFVGGISHIERILKHIQDNSFPKFEHAQREETTLCTLTEESCREVLGEFAWITMAYEKERGISFPDRQKLILKLFKNAAKAYQKERGSPFEYYHLRNLMKYVRNYALITDKLMPNLYQILIAAKGCVDPNYAYEVWKLATDYPHLKNIDQLPQLNLKAEEVWGQSQKIKFELLDKGRKQNFFQRRKKEKKPHLFLPPSPFTLCSYQPEDLSVERFGSFLQKKGVQLLSEEGARTVPFTTSLEDGIDTRETIRHYLEHKLFVKMKGKPPGNVGSVVVIFNEDNPEEKTEKYPWKMTWLGENEQESDMALYATSIHETIVGPGISRCTYGGFLMSYPPRRMHDVWSDPDYWFCRKKSEILLAAGIDYSVDSVIVYVAKDPPRSFFKSFARRFGKKVIYIPIGQLSPITLEKIRIFHVLDGYDKREIAGEYIY